MVRIAGGSVAHRRLLACATAAVAVLVTLIAAPSAPAAFPGANGKIAFSQAGQIKVVNPDGTGETGLRPGRSPDWSPDGSQIVFEQSGDIRLMPADGSNERTFAGATFDENGRGFSYDHPAWSPDGRQLVVEFYDCNTDVCEEYVHTLTIDRSCCDGLIRYTGLPAVPSWSPDGLRIALWSSNDDFSGATALYSILPSGGDPRKVYQEAIGSIDNIDWSPDGSRIVFSMRTDGQPTHEVYVVPSGGGPLTQLTNNTNEDAGPVWSPDGTQIAFSSNRDGDYEIYRMDPDGSNVTRVTDNTVRDEAPSWQPIRLGYVRPKGAGPLHASLVPAYDECTASDRVHGPPLEHPSCSSPRATSVGTDGGLTVGTSDANGAAAEFAGSLRLSVHPGDPATPADQADVALVFNATDVRCTLVVAPCDTANTEAGNDYAGPVRGMVSLRVTDRDNNPHPGGPGPGTVSDATLSFRPLCTSTGPEVGSTCSLSTTVDALVPGLVKEGRRAIWQLGQVTVWDAGPDGDVDTTAGDAVFLRQGIFVP